jgi:hypothetical protein
VVKAASDMTEEELTNLFARLGATDPIVWAKSQVEEGIPQLARYLFLRQAWRLVTLPSDHRWIDAYLKAQPGKPGGQIARALVRLQALGASNEDLTTVVRVMQWELLHGLCYLLSDPDLVEPEVQDMNWGLFQTDDGGRPTAHIGGLHESVLETDPTGSEMCE